MKERRELKKIELYILACFNTSLVYVTKQNKQKIKMYVSKKCIK